MSLSVVASYDRATNAYFRSDKSSGEISKSLIVLEPSLSLNQRVPDSSPGAPTRLFIGLGTLRDSHSDKRSAAVPITQLLLFAPRAAFWCRRSVACVCVLRRSAIAVPIDGGPPRAFGAREISTLRSPVAERGVHFESQLLRRCPWRLPHGLAGRAHFQACPEEWIDRRHKHFLRTLAIAAISTLLTAASFMLVLLASARQKTGGRGR